MKKIIVIGCPGSGKSTFSRALQAKTGIPLFHLDRMNWNTDGTCVDRSVFQQRLEQAIQQDQWILDGNYGSTIERRLQVCDTVFFLDYPPEVCRKGILDRRGKPRPDLPWVETEPDAQLLAFVEYFPSQVRPRIMALLRRYPRELHLFQSRQEAAAFLDALPTP